YWSVIMMTSTDVIDALRQQRSQTTPSVDADPYDTAQQPTQLRMRDLFDVAMAHRDLPLEEVEKLLDHSAYQTRLAAVCILDVKARRAGSREERRPLYAL